MNIKATDTKTDCSVNILLCSNCKRILEIDPVINRGVGAVYTCVCGHKTGIRKPKD